jgi:hypothetical protein
MSDYQNIAGAQGVKIVDVGISQKAIRLGRTIDRLPPGKHVIILEVSKDKTWNTQVIDAQTWKNIDNALTKGV